MKLWRPSVVSFLEPSSEPCASSSDRPSTEVLNAKLRSSIGLLLLDQGLYGQAEPYLDQVVTDRRAELRERHPDTLGSINNLGLLYESQGRYSDAEPLYLEALEGGAGGESPGQPPQHQQPRLPLHENEKLPGRGRTSPRGSEDGLHLRVWRNLCPGLEKAARYLQGGHCQQGPKGEVPLWIREKKAEVPPGGVIVIRATEKYSYCSSYHSMALLACYPPYCNNNVKEACCAYLISIIATIIISAITTAVTSTYNHRHQHTWRSSTWYHPRVPVV